MTPSEPVDFVIIGAGAAGLMAARELARAGRKIVILEARGRCGGRIDPLPAAEFGYPAEGGAEFVHGAAALTRSLMREAGLSFAPMGGTRWRAAEGTLALDVGAAPHAVELRRALAALAADMPVAEFLATRFGAPRFAELRWSITRMVEGFDAADPNRASTFALREEWMGRGLGQQGRIAEGYGALVAFLLEDCRRHGATIHFRAAVATIEADGGGIAARCRDGRRFDAGGAILAVPLPLLGEITLPPAAAVARAASAEIGFGNVVKILLRFATPWWTQAGGRDLGDLSFVISRARVPTWWTQHPAGQPVLTGWFAGPKADSVADLSTDALVAMGMASLADIFAAPLDRLQSLLLASRAINWGNDEFARGAYSYATPKTRQAQARLRQPAENVFFSGEALYAGPEMGTVEAALASGSETAQLILSSR